MLGKEKSKIVLSKKRAVVLAVLLAAAVLIGILLTTSMGGEENVAFEELKESQIPADISADVIPEYKTLERALACKVDDDVYVIVTRGEKPTSGFAVSVDRISLAEEDGKTTLIVYADFEDPQKETAISQIITYPVSVVKTDLDRLPDTIELRIQY